MAKKINSILSAAAAAILSVVGLNSCIIRNGFSCVYGGPPEDSRYEDSQEPEVLEQEEESSGNASSDF